MEISHCAILVLEDSLGRFLLYLRDDKPNIPFPNMWALIGGLVEKGENPLEAARREAAEELRHHDGSPYGLNNPQLLFDYERRDLPRTEHVFRESLKASLDDLILTEGQRLELFDERKIRQAADIAPHHKEILLQYLKEARLGNTQGTK